MTETIVVLGQHAADYAASSVWIPISAPGLRCSEAQRVGVNVATGKAVYQLKHPLAREFLTDDLYVIEDGELVLLYPPQEAAVDV